MIDSVFPALLGEQNRNLVAALVEWKEGSARSIKRHRTDVVASVLTRLNHPAVDSVSSAFAAITRSSPEMLLDGYLKRRQKHMREESGDIRTRRFDAERKKYAALLSQIIIEAKLPIVALIQTLDDSANAWLRIFSTRRANTLKSRYKCWKPFQVWLEINRGRKYPSGIQDCLDYLAQRVADGCGRTIPESFHITLSMLEQVGRVPEDCRISNVDLWRSHVKSYTAELNESAPPTKVAPMFTIAVLLALELVVVDSEAVLFARALAWVLLVMVWCSMRADDLQSVQPHRMLFSNYGLRLHLGRTKTTGPDKRQREVSAHIFRTTSLTGEDWLGVGLALWEADPLNFSRNYMVMEPRPNWESVKRKYIEPSILTANISRLLGSLGTPRRGSGGWTVNSNVLLLPDGLESFYTGHSARNFLTSIAATLEFSREQRAYLGRWSMGMASSEEYVRTSRQVIFHIQKTVNEALVCGHPASYMEDEAIDSLVSYAVSHGMNASRIRKRHIVMSNLTGKVCLGGMFPTMDIPKDEWTVLEDFVEDRQDQLEQKALEHAESAERQEKAQLDCRYFITITRRTGFRRLHLNGCFVQPEKCREVIYLNQVEQNDFDAICKMCKRKMAAKSRTSDGQESSTSPSSSSTDVSCGVALPDKD